jgi:quinol monooxygenase YgiN
MLRLKSSASGIAEMLQSLRVLMRPARAEKGLINCHLYLDADDTDVVLYEERWATREDFEDQLRSPRYTRLLALMESAMEQPSLEFHFVSKTRGLEYVAAVRGKT